MLRTGALALTTSLLLAAKTQDELYKEKVASARSWEAVSYVLVGLGLFVIIIGTLIAIVTDRRKKARKETAPDEQPGAPYR